MKKHLNTIDIQKIEKQSDFLTSQQAKNMAVIKLLEEWMADESGYDEEVWPIVKRSLEDDRLSHRRRFSD